MTYYDDTGVLAWDENENGNFIGRDDYGCIRATVYCNKFGSWQIVMDQGGDGCLVADEYFDHAETAKSRAEGIVQGADVRFFISASEASTPWVLQKAMANRKPTYGRKQGSESVSVKCAASGKWYFVVYQGANTSGPNGWYANADSAMRAYDSRVVAPVKKTPDAEIEDLMDKIDFN